VIIIVLLLMILSYGLGYWYGDAHNCSAIGFFVCLLAAAATIVLCGVGPIP
jgi:hypothetical protein